MTAFGRRPRPVSPKSFANMASPQLIECPQCRRESVTKLVACRFACPHCGHIFDWMDRGKRKLETAKEVTT